mgnify:CR=1 FL=1
MDTEVKGIGGVGIKVTEEMFVKMIDADWFSDDLEPSDDACECLNEAAGIIGCKLEVGGNTANDGTSCCYLLLDSDTLFGCVEKSAEFLGKLNDIGINVTSKDLKIISDFVIY